MEKTGSTVRVMMTRTSRCWRQQQWQQQRQPLHTWQWLQSLVPVMMTVMMGMPQLRLEVLVLVMGATGLGRTWQQQQHR